MRTSSRAFAIASLALAVSRRAFCVPVLPKLHRDPLELTEEEHEDKSDFDFVPHSPKLMDHMEEYDDYLPQHYDMWHKYLAHDEEAARHRAEQSDHEAHFVKNGENRRVHKSEAPWEPGHAEASQGFDRTVELIRQLYEEHERNAGKKADAKHKEDTIAAAPSTTSDVGGAHAKPVLKSNETHSGASAPQDGDGSVAAAKLFDEHINRTNAQTHSAVFSKESSHSGHEPSEQSHSMAQHVMSTDYDHLFQREKGKA